MTALVSSYGITALAAYGIAGKLETVLVYPAMAFNMVLTVITGQCRGGRRFDRAGTYMSCAVRYGGGLLLLLSGIVVLCSGQLSFLFVHSTGIERLVKAYFLIVGAGYCFNAVTGCCLG